MADASRFSVRCDSRRAARQLRMRCRFEDQDMCNHRSGLITTPPGTSSSTRVTNAYWACTRLGPGTKGAHDHRYSNGLLALLVCLCLCAIRMSGEETYAPMRPMLLTAATNAASSTGSAIDENTMTALFSEEAICIRMRRFIEQ